MENKHLIVICIAVIAIVLIACTALIYMTLEKETHIGIDFTEINQGDNLTINLTDENGNPIANQTVQITINNQTYNRTTDNTGKTQLAINLEPGEYNISVKYDGKFFKYKSSNITQVLKVSLKFTGSTGYNHPEYIDGIRVDPKTYHAATLQGYDASGREYVWFGGWIPLDEFRSNDKYRNYY